MSTSCVDIGVKLNAHIPKISTAPSHQRVYHSVLNIASRKHRWIFSQKSACTPTLRVPIPSFLAPTRETRILRNNRHTFKRGEIFSTIFVYFNILSRRIYILNLVILIFANNNINILVNFSFFLPLKTEITASCAILSRIDVFKYFNVHLRIIER